MLSYHSAFSSSVSLETLSRLIGTPDCPVLIDVRIDEDFDADPRFIPGSIRRSAFEVADWADGFAGAAAIVICQKGLKLSAGAAAWMRHAGARAQHLVGGIEAWNDAGLPTVPARALPPRDGQGRTVWVTRERPKIDRIACPWLIRRFVDPSAVFLFVAESEVAAVADKLGATAFDIEGAFWSHRGDRCSFDTMLAEFGLQTPPLMRLAEIVRGADTARLDLAAEAAGLLAASLGLSVMYKNDLDQLEAGMGIYDAFYRWCRDAADETHNWPAAGAEVRA